MRLSGRRARASAGTRESGCEFGEHRTKKPLSETNRAGGAGDPAEYHYTNQSGCMDVEGMDDLEEFGLVKAALSALAVEEPTQLEILKIIAGLLHLGQVRRSYPGASLVRLSS